MRKQEKKYLVRGGVSRPPESTDFCPIFATSLWIIAAVVTVPDLEGPVVLSVGTLYHRRNSFWTGLPPVQWYPGEMGLFTALPLR